MIFAPVGSTGQKSRSDPGTFLGAGAHSAKRQPDLTSQASRCATPRPPGQTPVRGGGDESNDDEDENEPETPTPTNTPALPPIDPVTVYPYPYP